MAEQRNLKILSGLIPKCPVCGTPMTMNSRCDNSFMQGEGWYSAANRYGDFIKRHKDMRIFLLKLGVGENTSVFCSSSTRHKLRKNRIKQQVSGVLHNKAREYEKRWCV